MHCDVTTIAVSLSPNISRPNNWRIVINIAGDMYNYKHHVG